jgi:hypothetical protein
MLTPKKAVLAGVLGGTLGLAASTLVSNPANATPCMASDFVGGSSCDKCVIEEIDGYECHRAEYGVCWTEERDPDCSNWW